MCIMCIIGRHNGFRAVRTNCATQQYKNSVCVLVIHIYTKKCPKTNRWISVCSPGTDIPISVVWDCGRREDNEKRK